MTYKFSATSEALADVKEILAFNCRFSERYQHKVEEALKQAFTDIKQEPERFPTFFYRPAYRRAFAGDYNVLYKVNERKSKVTVIRVLHYRRNIDTLLPSIGQEE
ncbi:MAG: type II toxin-antitoxin system RelE/ParE family toxin [Coriobacteriales bacterium]|nr:type II toxin-antitoxin system RelE/ParE family toxin [Coriobacteriales bacterium]